MGIIVGIIIEPTIFRQFYNCPIFVGSDGCHRKVTRMSPEGFRVCAGKSSLSVAKAFAPSAHTPSDAFIFVVYCIGSFFVMISVSAPPLVVSNDIPI